MTFCKKKQLETCAEETTDKNEESKRKEITRNT